MERFSRFQDVMKAKLDKCVAKMKPIPLYESNCTVCVHEKVKRGIYCNLIASKSCENAIIVAATTAQRIYLSMKATRDKLLSDCTSFAVFFVKLVTYLLSLYWI